MKFSTLFCILLIVLSGSRVAAAQPIHYDSETFFKALGADQNMYGCNENPDVLTCKKWNGPNTFTTYPGCTNANKFPNNKLLDYQKWNYSCCEGWACLTLKDDYPKQPAMRSPIITVLGTAPFDRVWTLSVTYNTSMSINTNPASQGTGGFWTGTNCQAYEAQWITVPPGGTPVLETSIYPSDIPPGVTPTYQPIDMPQTVRKDVAFKMYIPNHATFGIPICEIELEVDGVTYWEHFAAVPLMPPNMSEGCYGWVECQAP